MPIIERCVPLNPGLDWRCRARSMPSNSLAAVFRLAQDCAARRVLGEDTDIVVDAYDETNTRIRPERIARDITRARGGMVGMVGVQSIQYPRAMDWRGGSTG